MPSTPSSAVSHAKNIRQGEGSDIHKPKGDSDPSKHNLLRKEECVAWLPDLGMPMGRNEELTGRRGDPHSRDYSWRGNDASSFQRVWDLEKGVARVFEGCLVGLIQ